MQPGDIVESVDMEMSDDENDSKPKGRVLVDLRSQDRDMRVGPSLSTSSHLDMDMRMIPLPSGQMPGSRSQLPSQDVRLMHAGPPPPPPPLQFHQNQAGFRQEQSDFHRSSQSVDFRPSQSSFHQNRPPLPPPPLNFLQSSQDFHQNQRDFRPHQQDFHPSQQDFEYRDIRSKQDFSTESSSRGGRYSQSTDHQQHHDSLPFHRNDRSNRGGGSGNGGGGRGFPRNRRDRYSDDHNMKQRTNLVNSRKSRSQDQQSSPEILPNNRPLLLPPEIVFDDDPQGRPIRMPEFEHGDNATSSTSVVVAATRESQERDDSGQNAMLQKRRTSRDTPSSQEAERGQQQQQQQQSYPAVGSSLPSDRERATSESDADQQQMNRVAATVIPITTDASDVQQNQYVPVSEYEEHVDTEHSAVAADKTASDGDGSAVPEGQEASFADNDRLTAGEQPTTGTINVPSNELKRPSANGSFDEQTTTHEEGGGNPNKKRTLLPNGPQAPIDSGGPNGGLLPHVGTPTELHPVMFEFGDGHGSPSFRPRIGVPSPFPPWRGGPPHRGGRGGFRGGPRAPWLDRGPRGPGAGNFPPRGLKRGGGQFRGSGFRGRGRGSNW